MVASFQQANASSEETKEQTVDLTLRKVYDFAMDAPLDEIRFILELPA